MNNIDNLYAWIFVLVSFPQGLVTGWIYSRCFETKINRTLFAFIVGIVSFTFVIPQAIFLIYVPYKPFIMYTMLTLSLLLFTVKGTSKIKVIVFVLLDICVDVLVEVILMIICVNINLVDFEAGVDNYDAGRILATVLFCVMTIPVKYMFERIWKRIVGKQKMKRMNPMLVAFPLAQCIAVMSIAVERSAGNSLQSETTYFFGMDTTKLIMFALFIFVIADVMYLYFISDLERKHELEGELQNARHMHQLEIAHYEDIAKKRYEVAKIRHDIKNQLVSVRAMIENGDIEQADTLISELEKNVAATNEYQYSVIPVVNALLSNKTAVAEEMEIDFKTDISIIDIGRISQNHICSIFCNLIDNAIKACEEIDKDRFIILKASSHQENIIISVENSCRSGKRVERKPNHYGLQILSDIAKEYEGSFAISPENGVCKSSVILKI